MTVFTYSQARQKLARVLDIAKREGSVQISRKDGSLFSLTALKKTKQSPFKIQGIKTRATTQDILDAIRETRER